jgi:hypothetical protein
MKPEQAKPLLAIAQQAAKWCVEKLEMREGGFGKDHEHADSERAALHIAHSIALCEIARLQATIDGR